MVNYEKFKAVRSALSSAISDDIGWLSHGRVPGQKPDPVFNPWMPFQVADFVAIMSECVAYCNPVEEPVVSAQFLDVGSGIGTKMMLAEVLFGLSPSGLEVDEEMARYAGDTYGQWTILKDALKYPNYYNFDIIWMYRPFRDGFKQAELEHKIFEEMKPGAIVAGAQWENQPGGFEIIVDDWETGHRGAWKKPLNWEAEAYDINEDEGNDDTPGRA
jgi:hypothetical protein